MQPIAMKVEPIGPHVIPGQKANATHNDQDGNRQVDNRVGAVCGQRDKRRVGGTHQIKARIAESGNGMENGFPYPENAEIAAENREHTKRADPLDHQGCADHKACQPHNATHFRGGHGLLHSSALG